MQYLSLETQNLNFAQLCAIGARYQGEVGTSGVRAEGLGGLENLLKAASKAADDFLLSNRSPRETAIKGAKNLAAFHDSQRPDVLKAQQAQLDRGVVHLRKWLSRQGAWFAGKDGLNWSATMRSTVIYDEELARQNATKIQIRGGVLLNMDGKAIDTSRMVTHFSGPGHAIYVMSAEGHLHLNAHNVGHYHHSSLLAGANVAGAGEISVRHGIVTSLSNKSGHYVPNQIHLLYVLGKLQQSGVALQFQIYLAGDHKRFRTVHEFMLYAGMDNESYERLQASNQPFRDAGYAVF